MNDNWSSVVVMTACVTSSSGHITSLWVDGSTHTVGEPARWSGLGFIARDLLGSISWSVHTRDCGHSVSFLCFMLHAKYLTLKGEVSFSHFMVILWSSFLLDNMLKYCRGGWWCPKCLPHTVNNHNEARDCIERREQWSIYTENATEEHETAAADRTHRTTRTRGQSPPKLLWGSEDTKGRGPDVLGVKPSIFHQSKSSHLAAVWVIQKEASSLSTALATPASSTVIHAAVLWAGYHRNCPSQTRQQQHSVCC